MEKRNPSPTIPSSFQHNHISKFQKGKTQHNPFPNGTDTLGKFRTYKNAGKNINVPNHVFQNTSWTQHAPASKNLSPQLNATKQLNALSFQMGCKWVVWCCMPGVNPRQRYAAICQLFIRLIRYSSPAIHQHITSLASYCSSPFYLNILNEPDQLEWTRYDVSHVTCISICVQQLLHDHNCAADSKYVRPSWSETEQIEKEHGFV